MRYRLLLPVFLLMLAFRPAFAERPVVTVLTLSGPIDPISARYVQRGLDRAWKDDATLAVIELDTPGGLESSMDKIVEKILGSPVPVAVYVSPQGARAASAGVFIAMAAHVAAMAPGTHIGAAHPVGSGGADIEGAMGEKVLNDSEAKLKALTELRGRSAAWPEEAVRRSVSLTEVEAVNRGVVDMPARTLSELVSALQGRTVETTKGARVINAVDAEIRRFEMNFVDRILAILVNPDIAYILLVIGIFGVIFELSAPGIGGAGIAGGIAIMLSLIAFGSLPTNIGGILFIVFAVILFIVDIKTPTHGILTAGGILAFVLGSFLLFPPWRPPALPPVPEIRVSPVTIVVMTGLTAAFFIFVVSKGLGAQRLRLVSGPGLLDGTVGTALTDLAPEGLVSAGGEQWSARAVENGIKAGDDVEVAGRDGLRLLVRRLGNTQGR